MSDYKHTLNLPYTDFPMKASLAEREPAVLKHWDTIHLYEQLSKQNKGKPVFILHDGPPYANGNTHIGHAVNKTLKDIVVKAKLLSGFDAPYVPGWDCHGLPIELNVEKKYGKAGDKLTPKAFREACRAYAYEQVEIQREEFKRLGIVGDWGNPYLTMDFKFEANIVRSLAKIIAKGHLQQGFKPVHWCIDCGSALAEAEVEYANKSSFAIDVRFQVVDESAFLSRLTFASSQGEGPISIPIWTTTPWTLPANEAVAVHPEHDYVLLQVHYAHGPERLLIAGGELLCAALERYGIAKWHELTRGQGKAFEGVLVHHPFYERQVPVVLGEHVTLETGTGAVHTAPAHGQDDYLVGVHYQLPLVNPVGSNGCFLPETPIFAGQHVLKANAAIITLLQERGRLLCERKLEHSYPHCWRHKTPLIFRATPQWFISMEQQGLRMQALRAIDTVQWVPEWGKARIMSMVEGRPDWCVSRQRTWCMPMALIVDKQSGALHPKMPVLLEKIAEFIEETGSEAWYEIELSVLLGEEANNYEKIYDSLDVWFDSGITHFAVLAQRPELRFPADLYLEGSDQHRGWFQSSLLTSVAMHGKAPYQTVLTHGFTVDDKGRKMSKSLGNVIAPEKVINQLGADILRLWIAATDYRNEIAVSDEILKRTAEAYRRIRNTVRFLLGNLHDFDPNQHVVPYENLLALDKWILDRAYHLQEEIKKAYDDYQFHLIYQKLHNFCIIEMGGFYLDIIKDRQYTTKKNSLPRRSAQTVLYHIAEAMVRWLAPILTFTAEEIWRYLPGERVDSVFLTTWYEYLQPLSPHLAVMQALGKSPEPLGFNRIYWEILISVREAVNKELEKQRNEGRLGSALEAEVTLYCEPVLEKALQLLGDELRFVLITSKADVLPEAMRSADAVSCSVKGLYIQVLPSECEKCIRCWHRRADIGQSIEHPELCGRCVENVMEGEGEQRKYA
jgi:isoleucyl-tRNA synthetase